MIKGMKRALIIVMVIVTGMSGISMFLEDVLHFSRANSATLILIMLCVVFVVVCPYKWLFGYENNERRTL